MVGLKSSAPETVQERQYFSSTEGLPPVITTLIGGAINEGERESGHSLNLHCLVCLAVKGLHDH